MELLTQYFDESIVLKRAVDITRTNPLSKKTALFYIHGGGWSKGSREQYHYHMEHFSKLGYLCASTGYRLVPSVHLGEQLTDVFTGYAQFVSYIRDGKLDIERIIVLGSSAGAHLASLLCLIEPGNNPFHIPMPAHWIKPAACVSINGPGTLEKWPDMDQTIKECIENLLGVPYEQPSELFTHASPTAYVNDLSPDFLFLVVGKEQYFPHSFVYEMKDKLIEHNKKAEVVLFPEAEHGFFYGLTTDEQLEALRILQQYINEQEHQGSKV